MALISTPPLQIGLEVPDAALRSSLEELRQEDRTEAEARPAILDDQTDVVKAPRQAAGWSRMASSHRHALLAG
jgi:ribosome-binding protein aMBF1 (putative translation factor)